MENIELRRASVDDLHVLWDLSLNMGSAKSDGYFDRALESQDAGSRLVFIASFQGQDVGYCMLAWEPKYAFFRKMDIPEIQDLNVLADFRRQGIGSFMIKHCEDLAQQEGKEFMGIGVGMDASYGAAQQLYVRRGYVPDGNGLTYDRKTIAHGAFHAVDDDMSLMLIKDLQK